MKDIFTYTDFRRYLKDKYKHLKTNTHHFSHRYFCRKAGLSSSATLKLVMEGKRNLSSTSIEKFIAGFGLKNLEAEYFRRLVRFTQAKTDVAKNRYFRKLLEIHTFRKIHPISVRQYGYFSNWYIPVIREMIPCPWFKEDPVEIAQLLFNQVEPEKVRQAIQLLKDLELVDTTPAGKLKKKTLHLKANDEFLPLSLRNYHREMIEQAGFAVERSDKNEREMSALTMSIDPEKIDGAKKEIRAFIDRMREYLGSSHFSQVYQLNVQFFNIMKRKGS